MERSSPPSASPDPEATSAQDGVTADGGRDPHVPEDAAHIVADELRVDRARRDCGRSDRLAGEAEEAARDVEEEEDGEDAG
jgi:hypothetical protein